MSGSINLSIVTTSYMPTEVGAFLKSLRKSLVGSLNWSYLFLASAGLAHLIFPPESLEAPACCS